MTRIFRFTALVLVLTFTLVPHLALAQNYSFSLDKMVVDVFWESDGTMRLEYLMVFTNDPSASPLDFVDIGLPTPEFNLSSAEASIDGAPIRDISLSPYVTNGIALGLGGDAIRPGATGEVLFSISGIQDVLYPDTEDETYVSAVFATTFFDSSFVYGTTDLTVIFHFPQEVQPDEPRWHAAPRDWPYDEPYPDFDSLGRIVYVWQNTAADGSKAYEFGASFPRQYVPADAILIPSVGQQLGVSDDVLIPGLCCIGFGVLFGGFIAIGVYSSRRRKLAYLPPKIAIEGHGIKRGLTAVEAAVLLETPLDRVLTMILFGVIKKGAARVVKEEPLEIDRIATFKEELRPYEEAFLAGMVDTGKGKRRKALQDLMIDLVQSVQKKMKGFSLKETRDYYRSIMDKAWKQVETAETPEVRSQRFDEGLEWTMLDDDFDDRTRRTFRTGPVYVPYWWWMYRPSYSGPRPSSTAGAPVARAPSSAPGRGVTIPKLPGSEFAASMVNGIQSTARNLVSNVTSFTSGVTKTTNPPPPPTSSSRSWSSSGRGGSCACACACACAGCACACAGGGR